MQLESLRCTMNKYSGNMKLMFGSSLTAKVIWKRVTLRNTTKHGVKGSQSFSICSVIVKIELLPVTRGT